MSGIELDKVVTSQDEAALMTIRNPDPDAALDEAAVMKARERDDVRAAMMLDQIKQKIQAGDDLSPEERIFYNRALDSDGRPEAPPEESETKENPEALRIDAIVAKLNAGQELTPEEEAFIGEIREKPAVPAKTYKIGGQEFSSDQLAEEMAKSMGVELKDLEPLGGEAIMKMLDNYHSARNKEEWQTAYTQRDQGLARQRRQVSEIASGLVQQSQFVRSQVEEARAALQQAQALASTNIDTEDIYTEDQRIDPVKLRTVNKVLEARENLPMLQNKVNSLNDQAVRTTGELNAQRFRDFQEAHPQYQLSMGIVEAAGLAQQGALQGQDLFKWLEMVEIFKSADGANLHPDDIYEYRMNARQLSVPPSSRTSNQRGPSPQSVVSREKSETEKLVAMLLKKRTQFSGASGGGGVARVPAPSKADIAAGTIAASARAAMGVTTVNPKMDDLGY